MKQEQLSLGIQAKPERRRKRRERAAWWFARMRELVESAPDIKPKVR